MGVWTEADEHRKEALNDTRSALKHIGAIVVDECYGSEEFTKEYKEELLEAITSLIKVRKILDPKSG